MRLPIHPVISAARNPFSRTMLSLAPGRVLSGVHWNYHILNPVHGDKTHTSRVFKAKVIPRKNTLNAPKWFVVFQ